MFLGRGALRAILLGGVFALAAAPPRAAAADAGWFEAGDTSLRTDLMLLNDAQVFRLPVSHWPLPRAAVRDALANAKAHFATNAAVSLALERVRARIDAIDGRPVVSLNARVIAGEPGLLRDFDTFGREDAELAGGADYAGGRTSVGLRAAAVASPDDGQEFRADGSHATVALGNWLLSANMLDRWWGPGTEGSLILSSNARPMPTFMVERATPKPFELPVLELLGPWRFSFAISQMEDQRQDIDAPLFMAWRVTIMPTREIELGFSRTAQFCGKQLTCTWNSFANMLLGNDNVGIDSTEATEPGNQMAGFDIRWSSPIGTWPYALYAQLIGEDESSYVPAKYLNQYGIEAWRPLTSGGLIRGYLEFSDTTCSASRSNPRFGCAYNQGRFNVEGYRYRGRVIGHTTDRDSELWALGATYTEPDGSLWSASARSAHLNRDRSPDPENTVSSVPATFRSLELGWRGNLLGQDLAVDLGVQSLEPLDAPRTTDAFGFVSWSYEFR